MLEIFHNNILPKYRKRKSSRIGNYIGDRARGEAENRDSKDFAQMIIRMVPKREGKNVGIMRKMLNSVLLNI